MRCEAEDCRDFMGIILFLEDCLDELILCEEVKNEVVVEEEVEDDDGDEENTCIFIFFLFFWVFFFPLFLENFNG